MTNVGTPIDGSTARTSFSPIRRSAAGTAAGPQARRSSRAHQSQNSGSSARLGARKPTYDPSPQRPLTSMISGSRVVGSAAHA